MPKYKSPEDFFKKVYKKGSEEYKYILIIGKEIKKKLEDYTLKRYRHMLAMWKQ